MKLMSSCYPKINVRVDTCMEYWWWRNLYCNARKQRHAMENHTHWIYSLANITLSSYKIWTLCFTLHINHTLTWKSPLWPLHACWLIWILIPVKENYPMIQVIDSLWFRYAWLLRVELEVGSQPSSTSHCNIIFYNINCMENITYKRTYWKSYNQMTKVFMKYKHSQKWNRPLNANQKYFLL